MGEKRLEVSVPAETSNNWVSDLCEQAAATAFNAPRSKRSINHATTPSAH
jgi:hypothetical protein